MFWLSSLYDLKAIRRTCDMVERAYSGTGFKPWVASLDWWERKACATDALLIQRFGYSMRQTADKVGHFNICANILNVHPYFIPGLIWGFLGQTRLDTSYFYHQHFPKYHFLNGFAAGQILFETLKPGMPPEWRCESHVVVNT